LNTESSQSAEPSLIHPLASIVERLDLAQLFPTGRPLEVELGSGDGSFLAEYARRHPETNFLGVERLLGRIKKLDRKGRLAGLTNLRGARIESAYLLQYLLPAHCAAAIHVYFPDPWPKKKHRKYRLINEHFPEIARIALAPGGTVYLRTDDAQYFAQMKAVFEACPAFSQIPTPQSLLEVLTDFERGFLARDIQTLRSAWELAGA